jgi:ubiquinone/menaquinone biosynthesis C-methylase UbiE
MAATRFLSHSQAARFYDALGTGLDTQAFYEAAALHELVAHLELRTCRSVVEFGSGTGRLAADLLDAHLAPEATYLGVDVSATMVRLANNNLRRFGKRAEVRQSDGRPHIDAADGSFDRFICTYVLDLMPDDEIAAVLNEAHRVLKPDGLLGLASLTHGPTPVSRLVSTLWRRLHGLSPWLVGGCRPIAISSFISNSQWHIAYTNIIVRFGVPSEIVVARALSTASLRSASN